MRKEERSELIHDALNFLDEEMIEEVDALRGSINDKKPASGLKKGASKRFTWKRWAALAASICLLIGINYVWNEYIVESDEYHDMNNDSLSKPESMEQNKEESKENITDSDDYHDEVEDNSGSINTESEILDGALHGYKEVYFGEKLLSGEELELMAKFMEAYENGDICEIEMESAAGMESNADGHLYFKFEDGSVKHLVLLGNGLVYNHDSSDFVEMDRRIYNIIVEILKGES